MNYLKISFVFLLCLVLVYSQDEGEFLEKDEEINDTENDVPKEGPVKTEIPDNNEEPNEETENEGTKELDQQNPPENKDENKNNEGQEEPETSETNEKPETPVENENPDEKNTPDTPAPESSENSESEAENPEREPISPATESDENFTENPSESGPKNTRDIAIITIGRIPLIPRFGGFPRSPFRPSGNNFPPFFRFPNRGSQEPEFPIRRPAFEDPLSKYSRAQRLRQLLQDMMALELKKFDIMINEYKNANEEEEEENIAIDNVHKGLDQFSDVLKQNQIFNFTEIIANQNTPTNDPNNSPSSDFEPIEPQEDRIRSRFEPIVLRFRNFN